MGLVAGLGTLLARGGGNSSREAGGVPASGSPQDT